ncbi:MAG: protocatechuate 3,4-dioxygenase subunit alpha [Hyphomicrobiales bacterium]|nr:protocatechuate 3,4-dioxygenase subunit alpha [Hyphomicrobiales bacterium]MBV9426316.1 protocatechuate 3,4-dioxygenase subunit alpha [Bradyrhizobiaceae bacterium]
MAGITPSQTVGPYFHYGLTPHDYDLGEVFANNLVTPDASGERIRIEGRVIDGDGQGISDSLVEIWQADSAGRYAHAADRRALPNASFKGFGRCDTDKDGGYSFETVKPGPVPGPNGGAQAPHIGVIVLSRGMLRHVYTRIYFSDEAKNDADPILALVPAERRATLIAKRADRNGQAVYTFDIRLQGDGETVFFDI